MRRRLRSSPDRHSHLPPGLTIRLLGVGLLATGLLSTCVDTAPARSCGVGTAEEDGVCQPTSRCQEGTINSDLGCIPIEDVSCAPGTTQVGSECVSALPRISCGRDTTERDGLCQLDQAPITCGPGATGVDGECIDPSPLTCGAGTEELDGACTAAPCGEGTVDVDGVCVDRDFAPEAGIEGLCPQLARTACESYQRCDCIGESDDVLAQARAWDADFCEVSFRLDSCVGLALTLAAYVVTGQFQPEQASLDTFVDELESGVDCTVTVPPFVSGGPSYLFDLLVPGVTEGDLCIDSRTCIDDTLACRAIFDGGGDGDGERYCLPPQPVGDVCGADTDCAADLYCQPGADGDDCQPRPGLAESCGGADGPCRDGACCQGGVCVATPLLVGDDCCDDGTCGDETLFCDAGQCKGLAGEGFVCNDSTPCQSHLVCREGLCRSQIPFCELDLL